MNSEKNMSEAGRDAKDNPAKNAPLVLASGSRARRTMLEKAGLAFEISPVDLDESAIIADLQDKVPVEDIAAALARQKALAYSATDRDALVIGGDQILYCDGCIYTKPENTAGARETLNALAGRTHRLISAVAVAGNNEIIWETFDSVSLTMTSLDEDDITSYLAAAGESVLNTVGCYELEGLGSWLFDAVDGDYFTVLGMPLLPLLDILQTYGYGPFGDKA